MAFPGRLTVGRGAELGHLAAALDRLAAGEGGVVWVEAGPGLGKSHLVADLADRATARNCGVLVGHGDQLMRSFPLSAVADCLEVSSWHTDPARAAIGRLLSGEAAGQVAFADPVLAAAEQMLVLVDRLCTDTPLVLVLENAHWADEASLTLVERISREVNQHPLLLVITTRPVMDDPPPSWENLRASAQTCLSLGPLPLADVVTLARAELAGEPGPRLTVLLQTAGGSPLYVGEILRTLEPGSLSVMADGSIDLEITDSVPSSLAGVVEHRLAVFRPEHLEAVQLAAVLGNEFTIEDMKWALGHDGVDVPAVLRAATAAGVVDVSNGSVCFTHELVRQVLLERTPPAVRAGLHDHIARTLAHARRPDLLVAGHLTAASDPLQTWALGWLAERSEGTLYAAAPAYAALLDRAVRAVNPDDPHWLPLTYRLVVVSFWLGHDDVVIDHGSAAIAQGTDPDMAARLRMQVMRSFSRLGRFEDAVQVVAPALADEGTSPVWRARLAAWSATAQAFMSRTERARSEGLAALAAASAIGDPLGIAYAHSGLAVVAEAGRQVAHLEAGMSVLGADPESLDLRLLLGGNRAARMGVLAMPGAEAAFDQLLVLAEQVGTYRTATVHAHASDYYFERGKWDDALLHIAQMDAAALRHPAFAYLHGLRAIIAYRRGESDMGARHLLAAGLPDTEPDKIAGPTGSHLTEALALRAEHAGDLDQALRVRRWYLQVPPGPRRDVRCHEAPPLVRLALARGDTAAAQAATNAVARFTGNPTLSGRLASESCAAMLDGDPGWLLAIATQYLDHDWRPYAAFALEEAAVRMAAAQDLTGARSRFVEATDLYLELGANWDLRRASARFRPFGIRRGAQTEPRAGGHGWASLTASELRISRRVAQGLSNAEIARELMVSRNTVQTHVSNVLGKLGRRSRVELARDVILNDAKTAGRAGP